MTEEMTFGSVIRTIVGIGLMLAILWTTAYLSGVWDLIFKADKTAEAYGVPYLYENWNNPILPVFLWQGKEDGDPHTVAEGKTPTGDVHGNVTAFTMVQVKPKETADSVGWLHFSEKKLNSNDYAAPVMTVKNKFGGKIIARYEYATFRDPSDPEQIQESLIYSTDPTRVPWEYFRKRPQGWYVGRYDVGLDWEGVAETEGIMVLNVEGAMRFPMREEVWFNDLYPGGNEMDTVYRTEQKSRLLLYAMNPEDENDIMASAELILTCYSPWWDAANRQLSDDQLDVLKRLDIASHFGCTVRMSEYEEEIILEGGEIGN